DRIIGRSGHRVICPSGHAKDKALFSRTDLNPLTIKQAAIGIPRLIGRQMTRSPDGPMTRSSDLVRYYSALYSRWGAQNWWPAQSRLEVIVGAYLTQNTNWSNVEKAIANLRHERVLSVRALREVPLARLQKLIRPSGYFRQKAKKLKTFVHF